MIGELIAGRGEALGRNLTNDEEAEIFIHNSTLVIYTGPNCNLSCPHCSVPCGTEYEGLPDPYTIDKVLSEGAEIRIPNVSVTQGEIFREENREVARVIACHAPNYHTNWMTNAVFAGTKENAGEWFEYLKANGLIIEKSRFVASFGKT